MRLIWILLSLIDCNVLQLIGFISEEFVDFFLVLNNSLSYDLTVLN